MTPAEAIAALDLIVHRADQTVPGHRGIKSVEFTAAEIAATQAALVVLARQPEEATSGP